MLEKRPVERNCWPEPVATYATVVPATRPTGQNPWRTSLARSWPLRFDSAGWSPSRRKRSERTAVPTTTNSIRPAAQSWWRRRRWTPTTAAAAGDPPPPPQPRARQAPRLVPGVGLLLELDRLAAPARAQPAAKPAGAAAPPPGALPPRGVEARAHDLRERAEAEVGRGGELVDGEVAREEARAAVAERLEALGRGERGAAPPQPRDAVLRALGGLGVLRSAAEQPH